MTESQNPPTVQFKHRCGRKPNDPSNITPSKLSPVNYTTSSITPGSPKHITEMSRQWRQ